MRLDENTFEEDYKDVLAQIEANSDYGRLRSREKKYMTAAEMGELLGLGKTNRYCISIILNGRKFLDCSGSTFPVLKSGMQIK